MKYKYLIFMVILLTTGCLRQESQDKTLFEKRVESFHIKKSTENKVGSKKFITYRGEFRLNNLRKIRLYLGGYSQEKEGIKPTSFSKSKAIYNNNILMPVNLDYIDIYIEDINGESEIKKYEL